MLRRGELTCRTEYSSAGERSLHTGEVVGSIPTAHTILRALLGSIRQLLAERYGNVREKSVQNRCNLFTVRTGRRTN